MGIVRVEGNAFFPEGSSAMCDREKSTAELFEELAALRRRVKSSEVERRRMEDELHRQSREALRQLLESHDRERQLIAYEIHDGFAQQLAAAISHLQACAQAEDPNPEDLVKVCDTALGLLRQCSAEARRLMTGLRPPVLDESGIAAAVRDLVDAANARGGPKVEFHSQIKSGRLEPLLENAVYRIIQECLTNARRYSKSDRVRIELVQEESRLRLTSTDWGIGFDPAAVDKGCFGLEGIRERSRLLGGHTVITSAPGKGTRVVVELPLVTGE